VTSSRSESASSSAEWGPTVAELSTFVQKRHPGVRGFSPQNLWRMRQIFDAYVGQPELSTLLRELPWSSNLHILTRSKRAEEREFYLRMATQQRWSVREVARQIDAAMFDRAVLNPPKVSTALRESRPGAESAFRDAYVVEFLELPHGHREADLHKSEEMSRKRARIPCPPVAHTDLAVPHSDRPDLTKVAAKARESV
jgi:predicted nuclease of restriction endonuclease-like (RecB) superfamily